MNKIFSLLFISASLCSLANAEVTDPQTRRWLLQNRAVGERADVLLQLEHDQLAETGAFDLLPFDAPKLHQLRPSQEAEHFFYENQNALLQLHQAKTDPSVQPSLTYQQLRQRYEQLRDLGTPSQRTCAEYYLGYIDYAEGRYDAALSHFNTLPMDDRYMPSSTFYRMQILYAQGKWDEASSTAESFLARPHVTGDDGIDYASLSTEALRILAECQLHDGKETEALQNFRKYMNQAPTPVATSAYNAGVLEFYDDQWQASARCASIAATNATHPQLRQFAYMLVGEASLQLGETQEALMAYRQAAQITDGEPQTREAAAYNVCAVTHSASYSVWGDEVQLLESFLNTYPTSRYADQVSEYLTEVYSTTRNYEAALASIAKVRQPSARLLGAKQHLHYQLGMQHYLNSRFSEAAHQFSEAIRLGTRDVVTLGESYFWRGESFYHLSRWSDASSDYQQFAKLNPKGCQAGLLQTAYYNQGYALMKQQDYASAIAPFERFIALPESSTGTSVEIHNDGIIRLADCYYYTRRFSQAQEFYHIATISQSVQRDYALFQEALMMGLQKKYSEKQRLLDRMIAECPNSQYVADAWLDKGRTSLLQGEASAAIGSFQQVIDGYPNSPIAPQAAVELAMTYNNMGQTEAAQRVYQLVAERYPESDAALTAAEDLHVLGVRQQLSQLPELYENAQYRQLLDSYRQLLAENIDFRDAQNMQLLAAKAHLMLGEDAPATELLQQASAELRTASGSEAKYLLAEQAFKREGKASAPTYEQATIHCTELIQSGTPHQYWLARAIILMSDILRLQGDTFTADEYLKSLQQNYSGSGDDISSLIEQRL